MKIPTLLQRALVAGALATSLGLATPVQAGVLIGTGYAIRLAEFRPQHRRVPRGGWIRRNV